MRNTIFATAIAMAGCVFAAAAHSNELPMAWQVDTGIDTSEYQLDNTPDYSHWSVQPYHWNASDWDLDIN